MPLNHILKKYNGINKFKKSQEQINHFTNMDIKLFAKNEKEIDSLLKTIRIYNQDIGMEFGIEKCGKRQITELTELPN